MSVVLFSTDTVMSMLRFVQINCCVISYRTTAVDYDTVRYVDPDGL